MPSRTRRSRRSRSKRRRARAGTQTLRARCFFAENARAQEKPKRVMQRQLSLPEKSRKIK